MRQIRRKATLVATLPRQQCHPRPTKDAAIHRRTVVRDGMHPFGDRLKSYGRNVA